MKTNLFIIASLMVLNVLMAQDNSAKSNNPKEYNFTVGRQKKAIFNDEFDNNANNWWKGNESAKITIENGKMVFRCQGITASTWQPINGLDGKSDFEIETSIKFISGQGDNGNGLLLGRNDKGNCLKFGFSNDGHYRVIKHENEKWTDILPWVKSSIVKSGDWNKITFRKIGSTSYFFLNKEFIYSYPAEELYGNLFGVEVNVDAYAEVDYYRVNQIVPDRANVVFLSPNADNASTSKLEYLLKFKINSVANIKSMHIFQNDFPINYPIDQLVRLENELFGEKVILLNEGENSIAIKADNGAGEAISTIKINYEQAAIGSNISKPGVKTSTAASLGSDVDINIPQNSIIPSRFALIFGNEDYASYQTSLGSEVNVAYAINDATAFKLYCNKVLGIEERNIFFFTNASSAVMRQNIDLISKISNALGGKAELFVYYAGHGLPDEVTKEPYLIPVDVSATNLSSGIKLSEVYQKLGNCNAKYATIFLDACFSGGGREAGLLAARGVKVKAKEDNVSGNLIVISASSGEQSALPYKDKKHGMFTYYLLKSMQQSKGNINYNKLFNEIKENVVIESLRTNYKEQNPTLNVSPALQSLWKSLNLY